MAELRLYKIVERDRLDNVVSLFTCLALLIERITATL